MPAFLCHPRLIQPVLTKHAACYHQPARTAHVNQTGSACLCVLRAQARVARTLQELGLQHVASSYVGAAGGARGISGGERR